MKPTLDTRASDWTGRVGLLFVWSGLIFYWGTGNDQWNILIYSGCVFCTVSGITNIIHLAIIDRTDASRGIGREKKILGEESGAAYSRLRSFPGDGGSLSDGYSREVDYREEEKRT